jgi:FAD/FMN-containing dehydrogenase
MPDKPAGFPKNIKLHSRTYRNWSQTIVVDELWTCEPQSADEVVQVCNWAKAQNPPWQVRAKGIRHGWSPLTIGEDTKPVANLIICDTTTYLTGLKMIPASGDAPPMVQAGVGATMLDLLAFLQAQPGGQGPAPGYSFPHVPAPGNLTVGGVLAINAHGTGVPTANEDFASSYGSLSNHILSFDAVVSSDTAPYDYAVKTFHRGDPYAAALLTHAGRAFLVGATLQVIDNYNLRCQSSMTITADTLFAAPVGGTPPAQSLASFMEGSGRVEAIWYPFTDAPWLKVWTVAPTQPDGSVEVTAPYNYPFSDNLPTWVTSMLSWITSVAPASTPTFEQMFAAFTKASLEDGLTDLWGASMNTLLYIKDTTLRVTANGYAIQMKRADVQQAVHDFAQEFQALLAKYAANGQYPVNSPLEIRVTGLDDPSKVYAAPGTTPSTPLISSLTYDAAAIANGWDCAVWFDVLTLPGTPASNDFYTELEAWFRARFVAPGARLLPEWSKGWAYTKAGGWTDPSFFAEMRTAFTADRDAGTDWNYVVATLKKYDAANLFSNTLLDTLFVVN